MWYVYLLRCKDNSVYTGITTNVERRVAQHNHDRGCTYTKKRGPVELLGYEVYPDRAIALRRERYLKGLTKEKKEAIVIGFLRPDKRDSG